MKIILRLLALKCAFLFSALAYNSYGQETMTPALWRSDLNFFKALIDTKYPHLYYNVTRQQFDSAIKATEGKIGQLSDTEMRMEFVKLVAMFRIGHTAVRQRLGTGNNLKPWVNRIPLRFQAFSDGIYITKIDSAYKEAAGGKVIRIGKTNIDEALKKMRSVISFENDQGFLSLLPYYFNIPEFLASAGVISNVDKIGVTYIKDGKEGIVTLSSIPIPPPTAHGPATNENWVDAFPANGKAPLWLKEPGKLRYFEYLTDSKTVYVRHAAVQEQPGENIASFFARTFEFADSVGAERFILDIRMNGGGNNYLNKPVITSAIKSRLNKKGHFFVVLGKETFSAAQNLTNELEKYTEVTFVGEPTSENVNFYGDSRTEILPASKLNLNLSWLWWQNLDPRDKRKWTAPHLAVDMTGQDYIRGIDPVINTILSYKPEIDAESTLRKHIGDEKYDEAISFARSYIADPLHRYFKSELETKINDYGYSLMNQDKFKKANEVLRINIEVYPESANAYDSYAESWLKLGNKEEAIKNYKIAISKDPNGITGKNAERMLGSIK